MPPEKQGYRTPGFAARGVGTTAGLETTQHGHRYKEPPLQWLPGQDSCDPGTKSLAPAFTGNGARASQNSDGTDEATIYRQDDAVYVRGTLGDKKAYRVRNLMGLAKSACRQLLGLGPDVLLLA